MWTNALLSLSLVAAIVQILALLREKRLREGKLREIKDQLNKASFERQAERKGRIKAQQDLRNSLSSGQSSEENVTSYPLTPIGIIRSCFSRRNGTPRQPLLVPMSRAILHLPVGGVPPESLQGLADYSHCWLLYLFHANTDLPRLWRDSPHRDVRAKIRVPRLNGGRMGVFATRSPHRPVPIGLSVAKIERVNGRDLVLSGVDLVDGTPILDIKPYLPFCDSVPEASVPSWINASGEEDPLYISHVSFGDGVESELAASWQSVKDKSLYESAEELRGLVSQVLSRDIRSAYQRGRGQAERSASASEGSVEGREGGGGEEGVSEFRSFSLVLEGVRFGYRVDKDQKIVVLSADVDSL